MSWRGKSEIIQTGPPIDAGVLKGGYDVAAGTENSLCPKNIRVTYSAIAIALTAGLRHLGVNPDPVEEKHLRKDSTTRYHKTLLCFDTAIRHEITVNGKKLIGSAQRRWPDVFLQHGSILVNRATSENWPDSVSLEELSGFSMEGNLLTASLSHGFTKTLGIQFTAEELSDYESALVDKLAADKYSR